MSFDADLGPINYVVVTFPSSPVPTTGLDRLLHLAEEGRILVLDVEFLRRDEDGSLVTVEAAGVGATAFAGASSRLIDADDIALVGASLPPGGVGVVVVYEDLTLLPVLRDWMAEGATIISEGPVVMDDLVDALGSDEEE